MPFISVWVSLRCILFFIGCKALQSLKAFNKFPLITITIIIIIIIIITIIINQRLYYLQRTIYSVLSTAKRCPAVFGLSHCCPLSRQVLKHTLTKPCQMVLWKVTLCCNRINCMIACAYHWRELPQVLLLSRQTRVCRDKILCRYKHNFVATKLSSRQAYSCRDKRRVLLRL